MTQRLDAALTRTAKRTTLGTGPFRKTRGGPVAVAAPEAKGVGGESKSNYKSIMVQP